MMHSDNGHTQLPDWQHIALFLDKIRERYGYDFRNYTEMTVQRRLKRFMLQNNIASLGELQDKLLKESFMFEHFIHEFTITVTEMFRDPEFYLSLRQNVLPALSTYPFIRVWDAGCATGEELYSLAILFHEENLLHKTTIYATDINQKALACAREGIYHLPEIEAYFENYTKSGGKFSLHDYFHSRYNSAIFNRNLIKNVVFYPHNLATDSSFNEFHLIVCRNVLIYFNRQLQEKVHGLFSDSMIPLCYLGLGSKETLTLSTESSKYEVVDKHAKIYKYSGLTARL